MPGHKRSSVCTAPRRAARFAAVASFVAYSWAGCWAAETQADPSDLPGYCVVHGWPMLPEGEVLSAVGGVGVDSQGNVVVFHRADRRWREPEPFDLRPIARPTIAVFDGRSGALLRTWGANTFALPHGLTVDANDHVWLTDVALQQVFEFSADGTQLRVLGERAVPGADPRHFDRPTAVAVARDGSFYVSDGYGNTRIMKFDRAGRLLSQWGTRGGGPGQFDVPHGIALDTSGRVYVADRGNRRVQVFDADGRYLAQWSSAVLGRPFAIALDRFGTAFVADGGDMPSSPPDRAGFVVVAPEAASIARYGRFGNHDGQFRLTHAIATDAHGSVYVGDVAGARVQKFVRCQRPERELRSR
jgi:peptidylamidoglycolate lyase